MRILQLHCSFIEYKPIKKEIELAEEAEKTRRRLEEVVVLLTTVENGDNESVAKKAIHEVQTSLRKLKLKRIIIYPYAHLSSNLATPASALRLLKEMETQSEKAGLETHRAPFGWNKEFTVSVKGHPLAEQSRTIIPAKSKKPKKTTSEAVAAEERMKSLWFILQPDGRQVPVEDFDFRGHENLEKLTRHELSKIRADQQMPPHVVLMKKLGISDYEPGSDPGNFRWYPKGRLIKSLLEEFVSLRARDHGAMEVETPIMYDFGHPSLADYLNRFPARQYIVKSDDKELFLRFAACFGQFLLVQDTQFSYKQMPLKIYELAHYSFRREQRGEVAGLRRLRAFTMPDYHGFCVNLDQTKAEFLKRFTLCTETLEGIGLSTEDYEIAIRLTKEFYEENKQFVESLVNLSGRPVLCEVWKERYFYFTLKWDFNFIDNQEKAAALSTDQIDVENARRYDITYTDEDGQKRHPLIMHCSPSGAIERCVYALLEKAYKEQKSGKRPMLPLWLSPTQVRIIPISDEHLKRSEDLTVTFETRNIRVDIDDRALTLSKRVREAEMEWIPYTIVIGAKEANSEIIPVRERSSGKIRKMTLKDLADEIARSQEGKPFKRIPLPKHLSDRPMFHGE